MKNLRLLLVIAFIFSLTMVKPKPAQAVNLGPFSVTLEFCQNIDKLATIVNSFTTVQWPVTGFPGVTFGMLQNTSAVMEFCNYMTTLEQMNTTQAIFFSGSYLNTLTKGKWDDHLKQADRTWNLANSVYDFQSGEGRKGAFSSAQNYREMNDFAKESYAWSNRTFNKRDAELKTRGQREADMQNFAQVSYQRSIIKEMLTCPEPDSNTDYGKLYDDKIRPDIVKRDEAQEDYLFFKDRLFNMGPKFMDNDSDLAAYIKKVEDIEAFGWVYDDTVVNINLTTSIANPDKLDAEGHPVQEKKKINHKGQNFSVKENDTVPTSFKNIYGDKWKSYVTAKVIEAGSNGLLADPRVYIQAEFRDFNFECRERLLMQGYSTKAKDYDIVLQKKLEECRTNKKFDQKKTENLLNYYASEMHNALYRMKSANARMWTIESKQMGRNRSISTATTSQGYQQEEVKCSEKLTPAEMDQLALKQQSVNNDLTEIISKESAKQTMIAEEDMKNRAAVDADLTSKSNMLEDKRRQQQSISDQVTPTISAPNSGVRTGR